MNLTVIICTYTEERWDQIVAAIESVKRQTLRSIEIVVVVDHNPRLFERLRSEVTGIRVVENSDLRGLSGARNSGLAAAGGDVIAFLDDDAVAEPDWLERLSAHLNDGGGTILGVGGAVEPLWESRKPRWYPEEFYWVLGSTYRGLPESTAAVRNPMGGCMIWRREVFAAVGEFDTGLGHAGSLPAGCEETELCIRARKHWADGIFIYDPQAKIHHSTPDKRTTFAYFRSRCYMEGISKARVVKLVGSSAGLSSERSYTFQTLPRGVLRGLGDALRGDLSGLGRAGAIIAGLGITGIGYLVGSLKGGRVITRDQPTGAASPKRNGA